MNFANANVDNAIALLLAAHNAQQAEREASEKQTIIIRGDVTKADSATKLALTSIGFGKVFAPKVEKKRSPIHNEPKAQVVKQDTSKLKSSHGEVYEPAAWKPDLSAEDKAVLAANFFSAIKRAGKRVNEHGVLTFVGKTLNGEDVVAKDQRAAIAAYIGYNPFELLGSQLQSATAQANRELGITKLTGQTPKEVYSKLRTVEGVTFGLPDYTAKRKADLQGQQRNLVDEIIAHEKAGEATEALAKRAILVSVEAELASM